MTSSKFTLTLAENFRVRIFGYQSDNKYFAKSQKKINWNHLQFYLYFSQ